MTLRETRRADVRGGTVSRAAGVRAQLARLFQLVLTIQAERFPNARELADRCEVSRRTIYRDLELLADAGIPVRYRADRQGYEVDRGFFLPPVGLDEAEALALVVLSRQWGGGDGLGLVGRAWGGALKLAQGLPAEARERVMAAAGAFHEGPDPGEPAADRGAVHEALLGALSRLRQVRVWYREPASLDDVCTRLSPYRMVLHDGLWYAVGRSSLHRRIKVVSVARVRQAVVTEDRYVVPPRFRLERFLGQAWGVHRGRWRHAVRLRFSRRLAPELNDTRWHPTQRAVALADGRVDLHFVVDGLDEVARWVLRFGDQVEVLAPAELRHKLFAVASGLSDLYRPGAGSPGPVGLDRPDESDGGGWLTPPARGLE